MTNDLRFTLHQVDQLRADFAEIEAELETIHSARAASDGAAT
jgi:hypothetical protein